MFFLIKFLSMIVITNRELSEWINYTEDKHLMQTLTDRITHGSYANLAYQYKILI